MHFVWLMTTVILFISFLDNGNVKGNNLEIQVSQKLQEMTDLKEHMDSLQKNIEWYISSFLNNKDLTKLNSMVQGFAQEKVYRINLKKKIESMEKVYGQQLEDLATTIKNIEQKFKESMSKLNQTLGNLYEQINQWRVPKEVNGGWTVWGSWTSCTSSCGKGINNRVRTCTNPAPANGGNYCDGVGMEYNECQISSCKVNGGWTAWGSWTSCTSSCGKGINNRVRTCTNPAPINGGNYCDGVGMEYNECQISSCKVNGGWTAWGSWTSCTSSCGKGINNRVHTCTNPAPANGGKYCDGVGMEYNECQISSCKEIQERIPLLEGYWTGGNDISNEGQWVWSPRDVKMRFTVWWKGEPNDRDGEDCGELNPFSDFQMNDLQCLEKRYFICETLLFR